MNGATRGSALFAVVLLAGCTSSSKPDPGPGPGSLTPSTSPSTSTLASTPAPAPSSPSSPAPSPRPTKSKPLSPFEADPAVMALRTWSAQVARTINKGKIDEPDLRSLMTASLDRSMPAIAGGEIGHRYPGPVPFTPIAVTATSATAHEVKLCDVAAGYSLNPKTGKPFEKYRKQGIVAGAVLSNGRWLVSKFVLASFSCTTVKIPEPTW